MTDHWTGAEKKLARRVFDAALQAEFAALIAQVKQKAAALSVHEDIWKLGEWIERQRRQIDEKYDFRYSQLLWVFVRLLTEKRITIEQLQGLSEDKLDYIRRAAALSSD